MDWRPHFIRRNRRQHRTACRANLRWWGFSYLLLWNFFHAQILPRYLNNQIPNAENDGIYLITRSLTTRTGAGLDFIVGYTFMQRFYTVLDRDNRKVGFAMTPFTYDDTSN
ncbi:hypothetical protein BDR07DRAFT_1399407 [Suillus spraguei]|nr:hypothetical protein BDR07DRAFT_1399407 [Suillus spraguei]